MIRIDEIYNNTFWPWIQKNRPGFRVFFCDPFGRSDPDSVANYGSDEVHEHNYIFLFDQEPIHLNIHMQTFMHVYQSNADLNSDTSDSTNSKNRRLTKNGYLITSEFESESVDHVCQLYGWQPLYYFFHGWAALDWYRGYDKTFLIADPKDRTPTKTFIAPNRIVAGMRHHRLEMLYWIFKLGMTDNHISCPAVCPAEGISIGDAVQPLMTLYPDIENVFNQVNLPIEFAGETGSPMHSCWLSLFDQSADSLLYLVTETVASGQRLHITEKTFKPICLQMPFVIVGTKGSLAYLQKYGFKTFSELWDESYDDEPNDQIRIEKIATVLKSLDSMTIQQRQDLHHRARAIVEHNYNHFYGGAFEKILWDELNDMLNSIEVQS
jgi:hypothetical protein